jgi:hypothetical protein
VRRRQFITLLGGVAIAWPLAAHAQQAENPVRIGFLPIGSPSNSYDRSLVEAFRQGLREVGLVENRHVVLDFVWIRNEPEIPQAVRELMQRGAKLLIRAVQARQLRRNSKCRRFPFYSSTSATPSELDLSRASRAQATTSPGSATCTRT